MEKCLLVIKKGRERGREGEKKEGQRGEKGDKGG